MSSNTQPQSEERNPVLIIVMGVSGTGKSTLALSLSKIYRLPYLEGDEMHPKANIDKMSAGIPLNDEDREPWLESIRLNAEEIIREQRNEDKPMYGLIATCSSLKSYYRDILRGTRKVQKKVEETVDKEAAPPQEIRTVFVFLKGTRQVLWDRMSKRKGHYMKAEMLDSQFEALESPEDEEGVITVSVEDSTEEQLKNVRQELKNLGLV